MQREPRYYPIPLPPRKIAADDAELLRWMQSVANTNHANFCKVWQACDRAHDRIYALECWLMALGGAVIGLAGGVAYLVYRLFYANLM